MMKKVITAGIFLAISLAPACTAEPTSEVEAKRQELQERKKALEDKQQLAALEAEMKSVNQQINSMDKKGGHSESAAYTPNQSKGRGKITGESVILRAGNSVQSAKIGNFSKDEVVTILDQAAASAGNEAVLSGNTVLYTDNDTSEGITLPKGKAVIIESYDASNATYTITYRHPQKGPLYASVPSSALDYLHGDYWYYVSRSNGARGWVTGKYLQKM